MSMAAASSARQASHLAASTSRAVAAAVSLAAAPRAPRRRRRAVAAPSSASPQQQQPPPPPPPTRRPGPGPGPGPRGPPLPPGTIMGPEGTPLEVVKVEDLTSPDAWAAVAAVDRGERDGDGDAPPAATALALAAGDLAALLAFAAVGRASHGEPLDPAAVFATAGPFIAAWFPLALALGGFGARASGASGAGPAALAALKTWAVAVPLGVVFRSVARGYAPPAVFVGVTMGVTLFVMVGWRAAFGAVAAGGGGADDADANNNAASSPQQQQLAKRKDRRGGPLELLQVIMSLTKRW